MPFFKVYTFLKKYIMQNCASLQVQRRLSIKKTISLRKRAFLFTSRNLTASLTIEAALAISIFIYVTFAIMHFMIMFNYEINMQMVMNNIARDTTKKIYYINMAEKLIDSGKSDELESVKSKIIEKMDSNDYVDDEESTEEDLSESVNRVISISYFYASLTAKMGIENIAEKFVNLTNSKCNLEEGMVDIVASYYYHYPFFSIGNNIKIVQRARMKAWNGTDLTENINIVYITTTGSVYHTNKECRHLNLNISKKMFGELDSLRNKNGGKYKPCNICGTEELSSESVVYVTDNGNNYHSTLGCSGLTRGVIAIDISQIGDRPLCSDCGEKEE